MSLRLRNIFIRNLVNACFPLVGNLNEDFKENNRKPKKYFCGQLYKLVGGDSKCFKDNSYMIPTSVT